MKIQRGLYGHHHRNSGNAQQRRNPALLAPSDHARGRHGRAAEAESRAGAVHRHGRAGLAAGAVSGGRGRGHARPGRLRCGGLHQPAAADHPLDRRRGPQEARFRGRQAEGHQSVSEPADVRHAAEQRERAGTVPRLRHHRRRHRQLSHALPGERCLRADRQAERLRIDLPLRRPGQRVRHRRTARATAACIPSRHRRGWFLPAPRAACSAFCPAWSA